MKENENNKTAVRLGDTNTDETTAVLEDSTQRKAERLKKPVIFLLMGVVFLGCMYLIFKPSSAKKKTEDVGLNDAVPQASGAGLQSDKQKAYELEVLERKEQEKRDALMSLSDYWNTEKEQVEIEDLPVEENESSNDRRYLRAKNNPALTSYRSMQNTLGSFYQEDNNYESEILRRELDELKQQLAEKDATPSNNIESQLALMEKSYEMASKYLPSNVKPELTADRADSNVSARPAIQKEYFVGFTPVKKNPVSVLYREPTDSVFLAEWTSERHIGFYTANSPEQVVQPRNSIRACIQESQTVIGENSIRLRLLEQARAASRVIPQGTVLTANAKFQGGRLQLKINSIELEGNIIPVDITIYDLDGQQGLRVPYSPEMNALTEMAGNMSQTSGTSFMLTSSPGQQIAADLSRGVVQGVSGYFSKKVKTPKVTLKGGHLLFLLSK